MTPATLDPRFRWTRRAVDLGASSVSLFTLDDPDALLDVLTQEEFDRSDGRMPYWGTIWPSALALAARVAAGPRLDGTRVLDLGCGLGLVGLAALERGARVTFLDWEEVAVAAALASARASGHGERADGESADWRTPPPLAPFDLVLGADVLYEARNAVPVARFLADHVAPGGVAWIADPGRLHAASFDEAAASAGLSIVGRDVAPGEESGARVVVTRLAPSPRAPLRPILLTAFEPFGGRDVNPSWEAIRAFEGVRVAGRDVRVRRLPVVYGAVEAPLRAAIDALVPEVVVAFGLGNGLHVELVARNAYAPSRPLDEAGRAPPTERVSDGCPAALPTALPADAIVAALRARGFDAATSDDAGGFLCNEAFVHLMSLQPDERAPIARRGFVHLPDLGAASTLGGVYDLPALRRVVRIVLDATLEDLDAARV